MVVLGIGNRLMMDDGIGVYVVEELINNYKKDEIKYIVGETDVDYCLAEINDTDMLIIIDSTYSQSTPGAIRIFSLEEKYNECKLELSLHNVNLIDTVKQNYKKLNGFIIGIEAAKINYGIGLSKYLNSNFHKIVNQVNNIILRFSHTLNRIG